MARHLNASQDNVGSSPTNSSRTPGQIINDMVSESGDWTGFNHAVQTFFPRVKLPNGQKFISAVDLEGAGYKPLFLPNADPKWMLENFHQPFVWFGRAFFMPDLDHPDVIMLVLNVS